MTGTQKPIPANTVGGRSNLSAAAGSSDIATMLTYASSHSGLWYVPAGSYSYASFLTIPAGSNILFAGGTALLPSDPTSSCLRVLGGATNLFFDTGCRIGAIGATNARLGNAEASGINIGDTGSPASNVYIHADNLIIEGVAQDAIFCYRGATNVVVAGKITARNTGADSFHITDGCSNFDWMAELWAYGSGDDDFAVVSYHSNGRMVKNIRWREVHGRSQTGDGRGLSVVGGQDVTCDSFDFDGTTAAAVYAAAESSFDTYGVNNFTATGKAYNVDQHNIHSANVAIFSDVVGEVIQNVNITLTSSDPLKALVRRTGAQPISNVRVNGSFVS